MRRGDREVSDPKEILAILARCDSIRIAMRGAAYPYIVTVSFGIAEENGKTVIYWHCATEGLKTELLAADGRVAVEADIFHKIERLKHGVTARYESVCGYGLCSVVSEAQDVAYGLKCILAHYGCEDFQLETCPSLAYVRVYKIVLEALTAKKNLPVA